MLPTSYRQLIAFGLLAGSLGGCETAGDPGGSRTISDPDVPFTFAVRTEFTEETIDHADTRGDAVLGFGLGKHDVIAVRRVDDRRLPEGPVAHEVQGRKVTSELHRVEGTGFAIECQYQDERAEEVRSACRETVESVERK